MTCYFNMEVYMFDKKKKIAIILFLAMTLSNTTEAVYVQPDRPIEIIVDSIYKGIGSSIGKTIGKIIIEKTEKAINKMSAYLLAFMRPKKNNKKQNEYDQKQE